MSPSLAQAALQEEPITEKREGPGSQRTLLVNQVHGTRKEDDRILQL